MDCWKIAVYLFGHVQFIIKTSNHAVLNKAFLNGNFQKYEKQPFLHKYHKKGVPINIFGIIDFRLIPAIFIVKLSLGTIFDPLCYEKNWTESNKYTAIHENPK